MYKPKKQKQRGGQYITSTAPPAAISTQAISQSSLSYIAKESQVCTFGDVASLSVDDISSLVRAINSQISIDEQMIAQNNSQIAAIEYQINQPGGLQDQFNAADANYSSTLTAYINASTTLESTKNSLSTKIGELMGLSSLSDTILSSISGYETQFSSILTEIGTLDTQITQYESTYQAQLREYDIYSQQYSTSVYQLQSTIDAMNMNASTLSTVMFQYVSTSTLEQMLEVDYLQYTVKYVSAAQYAVVSTQTYYDYILQQISSQYNTIFSTSSLLRLAQLDLIIATATKKYRDSISRELSTISDYNNAKTLLDTILKGLTANPNDANLLAQKNSTQPVVSTLSALMYSASQDRIKNESTQKLVEQVNLAERLAIADARISTAADQLVAAQFKEAAVISTISGISTRIGVSKQTETGILSTMSSLSSIYASQKYQYEWISSKIGLYDISEGILSTQLRSTLANLSNFIGYSTLYKGQAQEYWSTYTYYSTLEYYTTSSISGYTTQRSTIINDISVLDGDITTLTNTITGEFTNLRTYGPQFYQYKESELIAEVEEYQYSMSQINSIVGTTTADLLLKKMQNLNRMDWLNFELTANLSLAADLRSSYTAEIGQISPMNTKIDALISDLNPLEIQFNSLIQLVLDEKTLKQKYIRTRKDLFDMEVNVYEDDTRLPSVKTTYDSKFLELNQTATDIRAKMQLRNDKYTPIKAVLADSVRRADILTILGGIQRFPDSLLNVTVNNSLILDESRDPSATLSEFAVLPPIPL
jgi:hypothetical protein